MKHKKLSFLILMVLVHLFSITAMADSVVLDINKMTGGFTASYSSPTYYSEYATQNYSATDKLPGVRIQSWGYNVHDTRTHFNNLYFYDETNIGFYSSYTNPGYSYQVETRSEDYRIYPSKGYYVSAISFDFIPGKHPRFDMDGVRVWANGDKASAVISPDEDTPGHFEAEFKPEDFNYYQPYIVLTVATQTEDSNPIFAHTYNFRITLTSLETDNYNLTYKVDGKEYKSFAITPGTALTPEQEPVKEGHTFSGWSEIPSTMPDNDVVVTGSFTVNIHTLTYKVDGVEYKTSNVAYGTTIIPESAPTKDGCTFSGWSEIPTTMPDYDVVITGQFTANSYTLIYILDGVVYKNLNVAYGTVLTAEESPTKEGYTFSGWSEIPATMPARDVIIMGSFTVNEYTLTYKVDGQEYKTSKVAYGTAITPEAAPTKEGYTFSGWSEVPETMPAKDFVIAGTFNVNNYNLIYMVDGTEYKTLSVAYDSVITPETNPTKEGYTFSGWGWIPQRMPAEDVTVTGTFSVNTYTLTYKVDGEEYKSSIVTYGTEITAEAEPTKKGYIFCGWSDIPEVMPAHDLTITGKFSLNSYPLIYIVDGDVIKTANVAYGTELTPEKTPTKDGYTFSGWSEIPATMPDSFVVVSGKFNANIYALTYKIGDDVYKTDSVAYGTNLKAETSPVKEGYTFSGWSFIPKKMPAEDVIVNGTFSINSYILTYKIDGEEYKTSTIPYGTEIIAEAEPTKEGCMFGGWTEIPATMPASDLTVTGKFRTNSYALVYILDGDLYKVDDVTYGSTLTAESESTKEGYTFSGWSEVPETMPANSIVVIGKFTVNKYKVTFMYGEEVLRTDSVEYGAKIPLPESLDKEGYTLIEWLDVPETMPARDIVIYASYTDGIKKVRNSENEKMRIYDLQGRRHTRMQRGVNIVRYSDGTTKRVMVK